MQMAFKRDIANMWLAMLQTGVPCTLAISNNRCADDSGMGPNGCQHDTSLAARVIFQIYVRI